MKIFISQPMSGRTIEDIISEREEAITKIKKIYGKDIEIINSLIAEDYKEYFERNFKQKIKNFNLYWLGMSIELLAEADIMVLCGKWMFSKGCKIERECAESYDIEVACLA